MDPYKYFSGYNLKNAEGNKSLGMLKNVQLGREIFTVSLVTYITVDFKKLVSDLLHADSALVERESSIDRKARLSQQPRNITIPLKLFHTQYRTV